MLKKMQMLGTVFLCLFVFSGLLSCRTPAGRTAGQVLDDAAISSVVKTKIFQDPYLSGFAVSVETFEGNVTLTGAVGSEYAKQRAGHHASSTDGVRNVNNLLTIR